MKEGQAACLMQTFAQVLRSMSLSADRQRSTYRHEIKTGTREFRFCRVQNSAGSRLHITSALALVAVVSHIWTAIVPWILTPDLT
jgi:hypothetical protein